MPRPLILACTLVVEGAVPEVLESERNDPVVAAVQLTVPPPRFEMVNGTGEGLGCPRKPLNVIELGLMPIFAGLTVSVTAMGCGLLVAPVALTVMVPE